MTAASPDPFGGGRAASRALLASLAFRVRHACGDAPRGFASFRVADGVRTPAELLTHLTDLLRFAATALESAGGDRPDHDPTRNRPARDGAAAGEAEAGEAGADLSWTDRLASFDAACATLDRRLAAGTPSGGRLTPEAMVRGPLADAVTHAGQLVLLRRLAGRPVAAVSYWRVTMDRPSDAS